MPPRRVAGFACPVPLSCAKTRNPCGRNSTFRHHTVTCRSTGRLRCGSERIAGILRRIHTKAGLVPTLEQCLADVRAGWPEI